MRTFMLTWNPRQLRPANLSAILHDIRQGKPSPYEWSTGSRNTLPPQARVFLVRQGLEPRGVVASGYSGDSSRTATRYCALHWTMAVDPDQCETLSVAELRSNPILAQVPWKIRAGGREFTSAEAAELERLWAALLNRLKKTELPLPCHVVPAEAEKGEPEVGLEKARRRWSETEDRLLREQAGRLSIPELARRHQRTSVAIIARLGRLGLLGGSAVPEPPTVADEGAGWTREEELALLQGYDAGLSIDLLAEKLQRDVNAVDARLCKLGRGIDEVT